MVAKAQILVGSSSPHSVWVGHWEALSGMAMHHMLEHGIHPMQVSQLMTAMPMFGQGANGHLHTTYHVQPAGPPLNYPSGSGFTAGQQPATTPFRW